MTLNGDTLVGNVGKPVEHADVKRMLAELGLPETPPAIEDGVSVAIEARDFGVALFFRYASQLRKVEALSSLPDDAVVLTDLKFAKKGYQGGPAYPGTLPRGLSFKEPRESVRARLGAPDRINPNIEADRWNFGREYLTITYNKTSQTVARVAYGIDWML